VFPTSALAAAESEQNGRQLTIADGQSPGMVQSERKASYSISHSVSRLVFAGLTMEQGAKTLGISLPVAERYWTFARTKKKSRQLDNSQGMINVLADRSLALAKRTSSG
jgi:hypothetical protein